LWLREREGSDALTEIERTLVAMLADWPVLRPSDWIRRVNRPENEKELAALRRAVRRGRPYGEDDWILRTAKRLGLGYTLRDRGRPRKRKGL